MLREWEKWQLRPGDCFLAESVLSSSEVLLAMMMDEP